MKQIILLLGSIMLINIFAYSQPGKLDNSFNDSGRIVGYNFGTCTGVALQSDSKILFGGPHDAPEGGVYIARVLKNGEADFNFGENGFAYSPSAPYPIYSGIQPILVQTDGKIITCGDGIVNNLNQIVLMRFLENGKIDSSFGENGISLISVAYNAIIYDMALQADGKIVISGLAIDYNAALPTGFLVERFTNNGFVDSSFGQDGTIVETLGHSFRGDGYPSVSIQPDNKIIAGFPVVDDPSSYFLVVRYLPDGSRDASFGVNGAAKANFNNHNNDNDYLFNTTIQQDGKILAVGLTDYRERTPAKVALARFNTNGTLDNSFGNEGLVTTLLGTQSSYGYDVAVQANDKILVTGTVFSKTSRNDLLLLRYLPNGAIDSSFAENGYTTLDFSDFYDYGNTLAVQSDGNIVVGGSSDFGRQSYLVARFIGDPTHPLYTKIKRWIRKHILNFEDSNPNAAYYVIEKSTTAAGAYMPVTKINAAAVNSTYSYPLAANIQAAGATDYYRIKTVNKDNSFTYSSPISSSDDAAVVAASLKIFPNPAKDRINIESAGSVKLRLQNGNGMVLLTQTINGKGSMDISKLHSGIYYVVNTETGESYKLVKE